MNDSIVLKGNQHNWYRRILRKIITKQTMSKKELRYYREIYRDNKNTCHSQIMFVN